MKSDHRSKSFHPLLSGQVEIPSHVDDIYDHPLKVVGCLLSRWGGGVVVERTRSNIFGIELVTAGNAVFIQNGRQYLVNPGQVFVLRKTCTHLYRTGPAGFLHKRCLTLEGPILEPLLYAANLAECDYVVPGPGSPVPHLLRTIHRLLGKKDTGLLSEISQLAYRLVIELGKVSRPQYPLPVHAALDFMQNNLSKTLTSEQIAKKTGLSPTHFNRLFKKHLQVSPVAFFIQKKMALAQYLLSHTSMSVKEVAAATGYDDPLYFSAQFKKHFRLAPSRFAHHVPASQAGGSPICPP
jgi:AraC-like DNA-binding protein